MRATRAVFCAAVLALAILPLRAADHSIEPIISHIPREPVDSTALAAVGYSKRLHALEIEFRDGLIYRYLDVPTKLHHELLAAESKARFYNQTIKGKYRCLRVRPPAQ